MIKFASGNHGDGVQNSFDNEGFYSENQNTEVQLQFFN